VTSTHEPPPPPRVTANEFDRMLLHREKTKKITLSHDQPNSTIWHLSQEHVPLPPKAAGTLPPRTMSRSRSNGNVRGVEEGRSNFFTKRDKPMRRRTDHGEREEMLEFEIASASGVSSPDGSPREGEEGSRRVGGDDDKWMGES
jgi:hypothetical protein